jgi:mRNA interferase HigB
VQAAARSSSSAINGSAGLRRRAQRHAAVDGIAVDNQRKLANAFPFWELGERMLPKWERANLDAAVRIIARRTLLHAWGRYRDAENPLKAWFKEVEVAHWAGSEDVRRQYRTASIVGDERVVFNIKGNSYRLVVAINYAAKIVFIKFFGTHAEYNKIDVVEVQHDD